MFKIAKEFQFDACHMLDGHNGKCHNLHGHTYRLLVEISNELITSGSSADMVMDYADIKSIVKQQIIDQLDHAYLYNQNNANESQFLPVSMIKLWETPTSYCEYHRSEK